MFMLLWVERILWSIIGDSGCVVTPVWGPMPAFHASYMSTGNMGTRPVDVVEYLSSLARKELTGIARARKMSAIREYFRFLEGVGVVLKSPTMGIETPKRERNSRQVLRSDEYTKMLSLAGANPRDYAILQIFLQTGIR